ncbi:hypothetical protein GWK47_013695 [Chionoecetes opilio]|uniref:Uncharacterized protein n=1 Tax=Chionoecetes opilio TaxID=41210 RepID=A0A8J5CNS2_CHIOP|nr:hypothetical protein GWK47_013695 [Chionoecetes opilio]
MSSSRNLVASNCSEPRRISSHRGEGKQTKTSHRPCLHHSLRCDEISSISQNMADYPDYWDQVDLENEIDAQGIVGRGRGRRRVVTDRMNPFTAMSDAEFFDRFRLKKASMSDLIEELEINFLPQ